MKWIGSNKIEDTQAISHKVFRGKTAIRELLLLVLLIFLAIPPIAAASYTLQIFGNADIGDAYEDYLYC
jgi:hypothetical protein